MQWERPNGASYYAVQYIAGNGTVILDVSRVNDTGAAVQTFTDPIALEAGTWYQFTIKAINDGGQSEVVSVNVQTGKKMYCFVLNCCCKGGLSAISIDLIRSLNYFSKKYSLFHN